MRYVTAREANQGFSHILKEAEDGEAIVITRRGRPVAMITPYLASDVAERELAIERIVGLMREGIPIGVIFAARDKAEPFSEVQIKLVETFADQAVIAIENVRLLNELRQRTTDLSESLEQQTATSEVLRVISSSPGELLPVFEAMLANHRQ